MPHRVSGKERNIMEDRFKFRAYFIPEEYYVKITQLNFDAEGNILEDNK